MIDLVFRVLVQTPFFNFFTQSRNMTNEIKTLTFYLYLKTHEFSCIEYQVVYICPLLSSWLLNGKLI